MVPSVTETPPGAIIKLLKNSSPSVIFKDMLTPDLVVQVLGRLKIEHPTWFLRSKGSGRYKRLNPTVSNVYKALALRVWLHGPGRSLCSTRSRERNLSEA